MSFPVGRCIAIGEHSLCRHYPRSDSSLFISTRFSFVRAIILVCCDSLEDQAPRAPSAALPPDSEGPLPTDPQLIDAANRVVLDNFSPYPRWKPYEAACQKLESREYRMQQVSGCWGVSGCWAVMVLGRYARQMVVEGVLAVVGSDMYAAAGSLAN